MLQAERTVTFLKNILPSIPIRDITSRIHGNGGTQFSKQPVPCWKRAGLRKTGSGAFPFPDIPWALSPLIKTEISCSVSSLSGRIKGPSPRPSPSFRTSPTGNGMKGPETAFPGSAILSLSLCGLRKRILTCLLQSIRYWVLKTISILN